MALIQTHLLLLLRTSKLTRPLLQKAASRSPLLRELVTCPLCLGWWLSLALVLPLRLRSSSVVAALLEAVAVASLGHLITLARERFLPCDGCSRTVDEEEFPIR
ncbi:MAG: hypothetical protein ACRD3E_11065 [Terriglobales bacterium]